MLPGLGDVKYSKGWAFGVGGWGTICYFFKDKIDTNASGQLVESKPKFGEKGLCFMLPV